jgi:sugar phosphate isomerase/epimerase
MLYSRREIGRIAAAAGVSAGLASARPNSNFSGVQIGVITYSFRSLPSGADQVLKYCTDCGISAIELMSNVAEGYAGAPMPGGGPPRGAGRRPPTPEQRAAMQKAAEGMKQWRLAASMDKYKTFRKMYADAGIQIYAFKLPPTMAMSGAEYDYIWNVAETLGANHITMELPTDDALLARVAEYAAKRKLRIAFHTHGQGGASGFEKALGASPYTALNLDVGHYFGVNGESPVPVIEKYHDRISSLHLKDRKAPSGGTAGANVAWGEGGTPLKEILQVMKKRKFKFPASIEFEYDTPAGSDAVAEVKKCVEYCKAALA